MKVMISTNPDLLEERFRGHKSITIEAEYGERCVEGSLLTLAHHGSRSNNPPPCKFEYDNSVFKDLSDKVNFSTDAVVGISHLDMDTIGGIMGIMGIRDCHYDTFWDLIAFIDVKGLHKVNESEWKEEDLVKSYACQALLSDMFREFKIKEDTVEDVTGRVLDIVDQVLSILSGMNTELIEKGKRFHDSQDQLNRNSYVQDEDGVILRIHSAFTNHLYRTPEGKLCVAVVAYRPQDGSITVSFSDPITKKIL